MLALVIDDSSTTRLLIARAMSELGFRVVEAGDGIAGLDALKKIPNIDVVLVDWIMPELDGLGFVKEARLDPRWRDVPLVMITTNVNLAHVTAALEAGASEYLMKPFTSEMIEDKLRLLGVLK